LYFNKDGMVGCFKHRSTLGSSFYEVSDEMQARARGNFGFPLVCEKCPFPKELTDRL
jgi:hypothetical protein